MQLGNGTTRAYAYDANSRLTTQIELNGVTPLVTIVDSYDAVGNRIGRNLDGVVTTWTYDDLYRLTHQNKTGQVCTYVLDPVGNLEVMWEATANPKTFTFDAADRLVTMVEGTGTTTYTYTGYGALEVTVDSRGTRTTNTYDGQDQLIKVQRGGGGVIASTSTYTFDGDGMRRTAQESNVAPTTMVWDGSDYLFLDGPSTDSLVLTLDGEIVACGSKDLLTDPLGSLVREISTGASLSSAFSFAPYGTPLSGTPTIPFRYIAAYGYFFDTNERDYVRARELEKRLGRWMQTDPLWPDERAFGYANANPSTRTDLFGLGKIDQCVFGSCFFSALTDSRNRKSAYALCLACIKLPFGEAKDICSRFPRKWIDPKNIQLQGLKKLFDECGTCGSGDVTVCCEHIASAVTTVGTPFFVGGPYPAQQKNSCQCDCVDAMKGDGPSGSPTYADVIAGLQACMPKGDFLGLLLEGLKAVAK